MEDKKILGVITARGGSKGIPGKNIKVLGKAGGKPLIVYTIEVAKKSKLITHLIVSTDSEEIAGVANSCGVEVPFLRPKELAEDTTTHVPVMQHAIKFMEEKNGIVYDYAVILPPTSPFRTPEDIDETIKKAIECNADGAFTMCEVDSKDHPLKVKKMIGEKILPYDKGSIEPYQRQKLPIVYKRNCSVYVIKRGLIMKDNSLFDGYSVGHIVSKERSIDIDDPVDWVKAEYMLKELQKQGLFL